VLLGNNVAGAGGIIEEDEEEEISNSDDDEDKKGDKVVKMKAKKASPLPRHSVRVESIT